MRQTAEWVRELAELEKPVIAAVNARPPAPAWDLPGV
jgi:hypothetical protein